VIVDLQISPANCEWHELRDASLAAERGGFSTLWTFDHLAGAALGGRTMLECFSLLGALAEATSTIELGCLVANVWNRQVGTLVAAAGSIARISGRHFHLGIGAGSSPTSRWAAEQVALGAELSESLDVRHQRVEHTLHLARRVWNGDSDPVLATVPRPLPSPGASLVVGVNSISLSRIAGRLADGVNVAWNHPRRDELLAAADQAADEVGRPPLERSVWTQFERKLLDAADPQRIAMHRAGIGRLILSAPTGPLPLAGDASG